MDCTGTVVLIGSIRALRGGITQPLISNTVSTITFELMRCPNSEVQKVLLLRVQQALLLRVQQGRLLQFLPHLGRLPRQAELFRNLSMATINSFRGHLFPGRRTM